ncbi:MAG: NUDIX domain-containing protein [Flavobacteriaceae bacterium]|nr:NUDIX domain-containing protein [Flavobacteriaceae bacterium]
MYKVFVKEYPIILTDSKNNLNHIIIIPFESVEIEKMVSLLEQDLMKEIYLYHPDLELMWTKFQSYFKVIEAAGGLVKNEFDEVLMIYRFDKWDLPKGKIDKRETRETTALREVKEECNVKNLEIVKPLSTTYHIYSENENERVLKISHWFEMKSTSAENLIPQKEEGITIVKYIDKNMRNEILCNTYTNIKILFDEVQFKQ